MSQVARVSGPGVRVGGGPKISLAPTAPAPGSAPRPQLILPDAPRVLPRKHATIGTSSGSTGWLAGHNPAAVAAVLIGATASAALAGIPVVRLESDRLPHETAKTEERSKHDEEDPGSDVERRAKKLEGSKTSMTREELASARGDLWRSFARWGSTIRSTIVSPFDIGGPRASTILLPSDPPPPTRGALVFAELAEDLESRMRITPRDMANPSTLELIDGLPGYKRLPESEIRDLFIEALKDVPLGELPGGNTLARAIRAFPGAGDVNAANMSFNELEDALGDVPKAWLKREFGPFLKKHKVEVTVIAVGAASTLRAASPDAARVMDRMLPSIKIFDEDATSSDGRTKVGVEGRLKYREERVLPDVDLSASANTKLGDVDLRAAVTGSVTLERDPKLTGTATVGAGTRTTIGPVDLRAGVTGSLPLTGGGPLTGTATAGARLGDSSRWADLSASVDETGKTRSELELGLRHDDGTLKISGTATATIGEGVATAPDGLGRAKLVLDAERNVRIGDSRGSLGVFVGAGSDLDGRHADVSAGVVFRLRF